VPEEYLKVAQTMGATRRDMWLHVIVPFIFPQVFLLMRINFFAAWMAVLAAEMVGLRSGLGALIMVGRESANMKLVIFGMFLIGLVGYAIDVVLSAIQKRYLWWSAREP
jgi:NitT/TauT family transport system permease protein